LLLVERNANWLMTCSHAAAPANVRGRKPCSMVKETLTRPGRRARQIGSMIRGMPPLGRSVTRLTGSGMCF
jgi:hypothetical protein